MACKKKMSEMEHKGDTHSLALFPNRQNTLFSIFMLLCCVLYIVFKPFYIFLL